MRSTAVVAGDRMTKASSTSDRTAVQNHSRACARLKGKRRRHTSRIVAGLTAKISLRAWMQLARESLPTPTPFPE